MRTTLASTRTLVLLGCVAGVLLAIAWPRLNLSYDLGYFLPAPQSDAQRLLIERLGQGPGTQLIFAVLPNASSEEAAQAARALRHHRDISRVLPENAAPTISSISAAIWQNRLLLTDLPTSIAAWQAVLDDRMMDTMVADDELLELIAADPALASIEALENATATASSPNFSAATERYLLLQTGSGAFDLNAQTATVADIRSTLFELGHSTATLYGSGVYGVDLQATVQRESMLFSGLASVALAGLVFWRFRTARLVLAVGMPLIVGGIAGLCALALLFDQVHGITLAFGFTLLGVAIDYPLHLFSYSQEAQEAQEAHQTQQPQQPTAVIWPTLGLGIASTLIAYLAFVLSGTAGMHQLGVFAVTGISVAAVSSWLLSPNKPAAAKQTAATELPAQANQPASQPVLRHLPWVLCVAASVALLHNKPLFSNDLSSMTPVPKATLRADSELRTRMGVADMRHVVSVRGDTLDTTLVRLEQVGARLRVAVANNQLKGFQSAVSLVPSKARQAERRAQLTALLASGNFERALANSEFDPKAFTDFISQLRARAQNNAPLTPQQLKTQSPELGPLLDSLLYRTDGGWVALVFLRGLTAPPEELRQSISAVDAVELVDLKEASLALVADYRSRVVTLLGSALIAIALLLLVATRSPGRVIWLLGTLAAALAASLVTGYFLLGGLSLFDVIALALVAGLGLDYGLFFSKLSRGAADRLTTARAIALCALSSFLVFGILGLSGVPLLRGLGVTVASGVAAAYLLARFGRGAKPANQI